MLKWNNPQGLKDLAIELVNQNSVSGTRSEGDMAKLVYELLKKTEYFKSNPHNVFIKPLNDSLDRKFVCALAEGDGECKDTLLLVSHMDTVDVQDFGNLKDYAFDPYEYTKRLDPNNIGEDAKKDLLSGEWLFGRGIMDMKTGAAIQMSLLEEYGMKEDFKGNLLLVVVPDEESNSEGAIAAIPFLNELIKERNLNPLAVLNCEPDFASYPGDDNKYVYFGTAGKLLLGCFFVGKEAHVGESLAGVNVDLIASEFIRRVEVNTDLSDKVGDEITLPPTCLKYRDLKDLYSVQTPVRGVTYINIPTLSMNPKEIIDKIKVYAKDALNESCEIVEKQRKIYKELSKLPVVGDKFNPVVYTYDELYDICVKAHGDEFKENLLKAISEWKKDSSLDERELSTKIVAETQKYCPVREPMIILYFAPPYYPHVGLKEETDFEKHIVNVCDRLIEKADKEYGEKILKQRYFQGLSDLSYFAIQDADKVVEYLKPNMPAWGIRYEVPIDEIKKLNVPVMNYGPHGRDPHKYTERILVDYSYNVTPKLVRFIVDELFKYNK